MRERFAAFTFVDRITEFDAGRSACGHFDVPPGITSFPGTLVAEAVGQLAAWVAMAAVDFRGRPVAALARECRYLGDVAPGQRIDLEVDIEHCDDDSIVYQGAASVDGARVRELEDCLGPMLPLADFDDPQAVGEHFALLCAAGATPGRFAGVPAPDLSPLEQQRRGEHGAALALELAAGLPPGAGGARFELGSVSDVKVRSFTPPGQTVELSARLRDAGTHAATVALTASVAGKRMASAGFGFRAEGRA